MQVLSSKDAQLTEAAEGGLADPAELTREAAILEQEKGELLARLQVIEARQAEIFRRYRSSDGSISNSGVGPGAQVGGSAELVRAILSGV